MSIIWVVFATLRLFFPFPTLAADQNFVIPVIPVRNPALWREGADMRHLYDMRDVATKSGLPITWLVHYDVIKDPQMVIFLKDLPKNNEIGIFLEVTQRLAGDSKVFFDWLNGPWSSPHKLYLQGYDTKDRIALINTFFEAFKTTMGSYPKSYGAWYIDGFSGGYIKEKFNAKTQLGLADQYSTDGYQVWGQHIDQPYYQDDASVIEPAQNAGDHILKVLWAPREPTLSYGESVDFSNFSLQANDYYRSKGLPHTYFEKTLKTLTTDTVSPVSGIVIGLEVGEVKKQYLEEFEKQLETIKKLSSNADFHITTMSDFDSKYRSQFSITPNSFIQSTTPEQSSYWYQTPHYRIGLFIKDNQLLLADLRFFHDSDLLDNDQLLIDKSPNLSRVVPALVDKVSLHNSYVLESDTSPPTITDNNPDNFTVKFNNQKLTFKPDQIILANTPADTKLQEQLFVTKNNNTLVISLPQTSTPQRPRCATPHGYYAGRFPCVKSFITNAFSHLPTVLYTNLSGTRFVGIKTSQESLFAFTFPRPSLRSQTFDAQIMGSFIDITSKFTPKFTWHGRQEDELPKDTTSKIISKQFSTYGQEQILNLIHQPKIFENGYYFIPKP